jgi:hypothetical protein
MVSHARPPWNWRVLVVRCRVAALYETLRDYSSLGELAKGDPDRPEVDAADIKRVMGDAAAPGSTAQRDGSAGRVDDAAAAEEGGGKDAEPEYPISDMKHS